MKTKFRPYTGWGVAHPIQVSLLLHCSSVSRKKTEPALIDFEKCLTTGDWPLLWPSRRPREGSGTQIFCQNIVLFQENHDVMNHESAIYQFDSFESTGLCLPAERIA